MKKLFTLALAACFGITAMAQPWSEGEEITDQVSWGNLSFENDPFDCWTWIQTNGSTTQTGGSFEMYDGGEAELYQIIQLPAGMYEVTCQGYYRGGTSWDDDPNTWAGTGANKWEDRAWIFASTGVYDITSEEFTEGKVFKTALMPRLFEENYSQIYAADSVTIAQMGWDPSDGHYDQCGGKWGPTSVPGSNLWFQAGFYQPFNDGMGTKYNTATFYLKEDGYVKVGIKKGAPHSADSFMATNFRLYYQGEPNEIVLAIEELDVASGRAQELKDEINIAGYYTLAGMLDDAIMEVDFDEADVESVQAATEQLELLTEQFKAYLADAKSLSLIIANVEDLCEAATYSGVAELQAALDAAKAVAENEDMSLDGPEAYAQALTALREARVQYMMSDGKVNGAYDFSALINFPFFCNNEYNPKWNAEKGYYEYNEEIESTWVQNIQEQGWKDVMNEHPDWIPVATDVKWTQDAEAIGEWIYNYQIQGWMGSIDNVTMQHGYTAVGAWAAEPQGGYQEMRQVITDLPNGYYSMGALFINAGEEPSKYNQYVYICPGQTPDDATMEKAQFTHKGEHWWWGAGNWPLYRTDDWQSLRTNMVKVEDGKVVIGSRSNGFYAVTGFQLYYYGDTPDFTAMLQSEYDAVKANEAESLTWLGDITAVDEILDAIQFPIEGYDAYAAALATLDEATKYIDAAKNAIGVFESSTLNNYLNTMTEYEEGSAEYLMLDQGFAFANELGTGDADTYKDAQAATDVYNAYLSYLRANAKAKTFDSEAIAAIIAEQEAFLTANYAGSAEKLADFEKQLAGPINEAIFKERGSDNASELNPMDITDLIVNPSLADGPATGWTCEGATPSINEYGREMAEIWNTGPFDIYQVIRNLPAGAYELRCRALYRDGGDPGSATGGVYYNWNYAAAMDMEFWENRNAELYLNDRMAYVPSLCSEYFEEPSFVGSFQIKDEDYGIGNDGTFLFYDELRDEDKAEYTLEDGTILYHSEIDYDNPGYPYDAKVVDGDVTYWYATSMAGIYCRYKNNPEAYHVSAQIMLEDNSDLRIGLRKTAAVGGDWLIYDDFQLFYLGKEVPTGINNATSAPADGVRYNLAGQVVNNSYKGIVIMNGKKTFVK